MESSGLTLGSLFDGSGGFPLGGVIAGITPIWSAEIEPFPVRVTEKRMPSVLQLGDISKINGADIPKVDIISFGSPCQDLSIAGKRNGLEGSRSGLFYEAIRIIREMRCATNGEYPRYAVWENRFQLPGGYSMPSFGVSPREENVSTLSQILQARVPETYYLTPKACQGILRRASVRGKALPTVLKVALERQALTA